MKIKLTRILDNLGPLRWWLLAGTVFLGCGIASAQVSANQRVIKVTPTFVYIDGGRDREIEIGDEFVIARPDSVNGEIAAIARGRILRLFARFAIAEVVPFAAAGSIAILDLAIPWQEWTGGEIGGSSAGADEIAAEESMVAKSDIGSGAAPDSVLAVVSKGIGPRGPDIFRHFRWSTFGGYQEQRGSDIRPVLRRATVAANSHGGFGFGLRLGWHLNRTLRLSLTYESVGLMLDDEVFGAIDSHHQSLALAVQYFALARFGVHTYLSGSLGYHFFGLDGKNLVADSARRPGVHLALGAELPLGAHWSLIGETGYQHVYRDEDLVNPANFRAFAGFGYGGTKGR